MKVKETLNLFSGLADILHAISDSDIYWSDGFTSAKAAGAVLGEDVRVHRVGRVRRGAHLALDLRYGGIW